LDNTRQRSGHSLTANLL